MNMMLENTYESITDARLDSLENVEDGEIYFCEGTENPARFIQETIAAILEGDSKHIVIYFRRTVATKKAKSLVKRIGIAVKAADRTKTIETIYDVPTDLFALLQKEQTFTERERSTAIHAFLKELEELRRVLPMAQNLVEYLEKNLQGWDREWIEEAVAFNVEKEWDVPIIVTMDATERLKLLVAQISRRSN